MSQFMLSHAGTRAKGRRGVLLAAIVLLALCGLAIVIAKSVVPASSAVPAADPRLILHARVQSIGGMLPGGVRLAGALYPTMPGRNTVHLVMHGAHGARLLSGRGRIALSVTMPGMAMAPVHVTLVPRGDGYSGDLTLPMFGSYRAAVVADTPAGRIAGTLILALPLP